MQPVASTTCYCCGKPLSDPLSVEMGIGPICRVNRREREHSKRESNMFGNRAEYTWGIDGQVLWLKDHGTTCRSLTNDLENCLLEITPDLPNGKTLTDYRIIYRDSEREWDGIRIVSLGDITLDLEWLKYQTERGQPYWSKIKIDFFPICEKDYTAAREAILNNERYQHGPRKI